jgi:hypothetical protein
MRNVEIRELVDEGEDTVWLASLLACFVKKVYNVFNMNSSLSKLGSTRRAINCTGLSHPLRVP